MGASAKRRQEGGSEECLPCQSLSPFSSLTPPLRSSKTHQAVPSSPRTSRSHFLCALARYLAPRLPQIQALGACVWQIGEAGFAHLRALFARRVKKGKDIQTTTPHSKQTRALPFRSSVRLVHQLKKKSVPATGAQSAFHSLASSPQQQHTHQAQEQNRGFSSSSSSPTPLPPAPTPGIMTLKVEELSTSQLITMVRFVSRGSGKGGWWAAKGKEHDEVPRSNSALTCPPFFPSPFYLYSSSSWSWAATSW